MDELRKKINTIAMILLPKVSERINVIMEKKFDDFFKEKSLNLETITISGESIQTLFRRDLESFLDENFKNNFEYTLSSILSSEIINVDFKTNIRLTWQNNMEFQFSIKKVKQNTNLFSV